MTLPPEEESYSPLARDVEVDDLALVVDHGVLEEFEKKTKKKNEGGGKGRRRAVRESKRAASFFFFFFFLRLQSGSTLLWDSIERDSLSLSLLLSLDAERASLLFRRAYILALSSHPTARAVL